MTFLIYKTSMFLQVYVSQNDLKYCTKYTSFHLFDISCVCGCQGTHEGSDWPTPVGFNKKCTCLLSSIWAISHDNNTIVSVLDCCGWILRATDNIDSASMLCIGHNCPPPFHRSFQCSTLFPQLSSLLIYTVIHCHTLSPPRWYIVNTTVKYCPISVKYCPISVIHGPISVKYCPISVIYCLISAATPSPLSHSLFTLLYTFPSTVPCCTLPSIAIHLPLHWRPEPRLWVDVSRAAPSQGLRITSSLVPAVVSPLSDSPATNAAVWLNIPRHRTLSNGQTLWSYY